MSSSIPNASPLRADDSPSLRDRTNNAAAAVSKSAEDAANYVGHKVEEATSAVGSGLESLGQSVREHGADDGFTGDAKNAISDTLESTGRYLQEERLTAIVEDIANVVRRNPVPALVAAVGLGFLIAQATGRRN